MLRNLFLVICVLCAAILIGCSKTETGNSNMATDNSNKGTTTTSKTAAAGDKIGVPECDDYISKYETCLRGKVPEAARAQLENALKMSRENWKKAAANDQTKSTLAAACKQASDAAAASMKAYGCTW
jgi:curli biogenesis system outer membrane secretion channel CsgG